MIFLSSVRSKQILKLTLNFHSATGSPAIIDGFLPFLLSNVWELVPCLQAQTHQAPVILSLSECCLVSEASHRGITATSEVQ